MHRTYIEENSTQRRRLFALTENITDEQLTRELKNGSTVATALAHLAFWDQYYLALLEKWTDGASPESSLLTSRGLNVDAINDSLQCISTAVPPRLTVSLVRTAAGRIDRTVENVTESLAELIEKHGQRRALWRAIHRREHLDRIEEVL